jgi:hypothetical protein
MPVMEKKRVAIRSAKRRTDAGHGIEAGRTTDPTPESGKTGSVGE